ncbi:TIGR03668 family PPOX class F420-dependent oxidoreductase [Amycolatopsis acidicola]|uniref:TIGR03668 family PPOX class F420-dependent oxidoreductase n=1 Tax=Amycolatopsis acidicola TaxID=2596893 RepID=A0A5N0VJB1_9PSEU|nr:TIGR03668 family PPOX class F420-dependent oxidoreductase [Amycolatopsis acidicola]KAA9166295.1 TIGR03668 family PPOX class F420-dependent oxidoreductase [Amycolatopsis acidicola]
MRLSEDEARARFTAARVARLATVDAAGVPHLVPVTFALDRGAIVFAVDHKPKRTTDLRRLRNIAANPSVAFLADAYDEDWTRLWWVRADGYAAVVPGHSVDALVAKYPQYRERPPEGPVVRTEVTKLSGWAAS